MSYIPQQILDEKWDADVIESGVEQQRKTETRWNMPRWEAWRVSQMTRPVQQPKLAGEYHASLNPKENELAMRIDAASPHVDPHIRAAQAVKEAQHEAQTTDMLREADRIRHSGETVDEFLEKTRQAIDESYKILTR